MNDFECVDIVNGKIITVGKLDGYPIVKHYKFRPSFPEWLDHVPYHQVPASLMNSFLGVERVTGTSRISPMSNVPESNVNWLAMTKEQKEQPATKTKFINAPKMKQVAKTIRNIAKRVRKSK